MAPLLSADWWYDPGNDYGKWAFVDKMLEFQTKLNVFCVASFAKFLTKTG